MQCRHLASSLAFAITTLLLLLSSQFHFLPPPSSSSSSSPHPPPPPPIHLSSARRLPSLTSPFTFRPALLLATCSNKIVSSPPPPPPVSLPDSTTIPHHFSSYRCLITRPKKIQKLDAVDHSQRAVTTALWCNFLVFSLKFGVWFVTSSHVMLAEVVHSVADFANQALLAYGLSSSKHAPDALHPYGYSKERFVWSLISAVGIFCLGSGATIVHGVQNLWTSQFHLFGLPPQNITYAALVIGGSFIIEGASLIVAIHAVKKGAAAEGMKVRDYIWRGHDPTAVAVMTEVNTVSLASTFLEWYVIQILHSLHDPQSYGKLALDHEMSEQKFKEI